MRASRTAHRILAGEAGAGAGLGEAASPSVAGASDTSSAEGEDLHAREHLGHALVIEGVAAWSAGDRDEALSKLDSATRTYASPLGVWREAEYLEAAGFVWDAVAVLRTLDELPLYSPFAHLRIAELSEGLGEEADAAAYYRSALAAWVEADPGFAPKARAREGLARSGGG